MRRSRSPAALLLSAALPLTLVTGCSTVGDRPAKQAAVGEMTDATPPAPAPSGTPTEKLPDDPADRFRRARRDLVRADTGAYTSTTEIGPISIKYSGEYRISSMSMNATVAMENPAGTMKFESLAVRRTLWFRILEGIPGVEEPTCWLQMDVDMLRELLEGLPAGAPAGLAPALSVLLLARPRGGTTQEVRADSDMYSIAATISGVTPLRLGIPWDSNARAPVTFQLSDDGDLAGWEADLSELLAAMADADMDVPRGFSELPTGKAGHIETSFYRPGAPVAMDPPKPREVVLFTKDDQNVESEMFACQKRSA